MRASLNSETEELKSFSVMTFYETSIEDESQSSKIKARRSWIRNIKDSYYEKSCQFKKIIDTSKHLYSGETLGLSGKLIGHFESSDHLLFKKFWGTPSGWISNRKKKVWSNLMHPIVWDSNTDKYLFQFQIDARSLLPHPYTLPFYILKERSYFFREVIDDDYIFELCNDWNYQNNLEFNVYIRSLLPKDILTRSIYFRARGKDLAYVAVVIASSHRDLIEVSSIWKNEHKLYLLLRECYEDVVREYSPNYLANLRVDFYIPEYKLAIEYQGLQHYEPVDFFGGCNTFQRQKENDNKKKLLLEKNGVSLLYWSYKENITYPTLVSKLQSIYNE